MNPAARLDASSPPAPVEARPSVNTFDVFDTLVARRCIEPFRIFEMVARRAGIANFVDARRLAEARAGGRPYDLDMIYAQLEGILGLGAEQAAACKQWEIAFELENVLPVAENIAAVADGDVLISDMYLGEATIRRLLDKAGLDKNVALVVSSDGKHSGRIWPQVLEKVAIRRHLGDNRHSDCAVPQRFGIDSRHTDVTAPNVVEKTLVDIGLRDLALICREARLVSWSPNPHLRALQMIQADFNLPILVLASIALTRLMQERACRSVLFSSRDCNLWLPVFRVVARRLGWVYQADYFYTSRITRKQPSDDYRAYARDALGNDAIVVDICGTGWSLAHLFQTLGLAGRNVFFLHRLPQAALYEGQAPAPPTVRFHSLLDGRPAGCDNTALEMCNYAGHGMVTDVRRIGSAAVPVFAEDRRSEATLAAVACQQACLLRAVDILDRHDLDRTLTLDDASIAALCGALYQGLTGQAALRHVFAAEHYVEDWNVMRFLGCLS